MPAPLAPMRPILSPGLSSRSALSSRLDAAREGNLLEADHGRSGNGAGRRLPRATRRAWRDEGRGFRPGVQRPARGTARRRPGAAPAARRRAREEPYCTGPAWQCRCRAGAAVWMRASAARAQAAAMAAASASTRSASRACRFSTSEPSTTATPWPLAWASRQARTARRRSPGLAHRPRWRRRSGADESASCRRSPGCGLARRPAPGPRHRPGPGARHPTPPVRGRGRP